MSEAAAAAGGDRRRRAEAAHGDEKGENGRKGFSRGFGEAAAIGGVKTRETAKEPSSFLLPKRGYSNPGWASATNPRLDRADITLAHQASWGLARLLPPGLSSPAAGAG